MVEYELINTISVNLGHWVKIDEAHRAKLPEGWRRFMFQEAAFNWSWLPSGSYGKLCCEIKVRHWKLEGKKAGIALAWQKAVRDKGRGRIEIVPGSEIWMDGKFEKWEMYESDYFKLPEWDGPMLLWIVGYGEELPEEIQNSKYTAPGIAMWTMGFFERVE
jgi:hypothetical protein